MTLEHRPSRVGLWALGIISVVKSGTVESSFKGRMRVTLSCLVVVVMLMTPASCQILQALLPRLVEDLPALLQAIITPPRTSASPRDSLFQARTGNEGEVGDRFCFGELGCLVTDSSFYHERYRPLNYHPKSREDVGVYFSVSSREDLLGVEFPALNTRQILSSSFRSNRKTKIIIHGYLGDQRMLWMDDMARAFLSTGDYNIVLVDWTTGAQGLYGQAAANARVVGLEVAHLVNWLRNQTGLQPQDVHLLGHSLGSHICGYAGERISGLGRITGLDPAEPYFQHLPPSVRLDPSDALFVDVIHTDSSHFSLGGGYGLREPVGHLDFYPNGGYNQPGCLPSIDAPIKLLFDNKISSNWWHSVGNSIGCNHLRATTLFMDSIVSECPYLAFQCDSFKHYRTGNCFSCGEDGSRCAPMGLHADTWPGRGQTGLLLYVATGPSDTLCMYHYRLQMKLGEMTTASVVGTINLSLLSHTGQQWYFNLTAGSPTKFDSGKTYTFLLQHSDDLSSSQAAQLTWSASSGDHSCHHTCDTSLPLSTLSLLNVEKFVQRKRISQPSLETKELVLCHGGTTGVIQVSSGNTVHLVASPTCSTP
ncbi:pancreatic triacylglycerol lipase-like isoform X1 [Homarus americanus]|uniref:pancreatic triacylglycerol lipase-like isoform X1 n=2 Tax=Homarus americanus TaxID=6706 RepID=UPI001C454D86|nr:pancreatic triacylglycerol lipase-like isoform X1 [Homarus americanus]